MDSMRSGDQPSAVRERILETATDLFYRRGVNNVGVDEVVATSGASKMSLYKHFGSKDMLVVAYVKRWDERWVAWLKEAVVSISSAPRERLLAVFEALERRFEEAGFRGCAYLNCPIELADDGHPAHRACLEDQEIVRAYLLELADEAGVQDPEALSHQLLMVLNGALLTAVLRSDSDVAGTARRTAKALISAA